MSRDINLEVTGIMIIHKIVHKITGPGEISYRENVSRDKKEAQYWALGHANIHRLGNRGKGG